MNSKQMKEENIYLFIRSKKLEKISSFLFHLLVSSFFLFFFPLE